jgi:DNA end-binding protein Ku
MLVLSTMLWPDEVREPTFPFLDAGVETRPAELAIANASTKSMATDFRPKRWHGQGSMCASPTEPCAPNGSP